MDLMPVKSFIEERWEEFLSHAKDLGYTKDDADDILEELDRQSEG